MHFNLLIIKQLTYHEIQDGNIYLRYLSPKGNYLNNIVIVGLRSISRVEF